MACRLGMIQNLSDGKELISLVIADKENRLDLICYIDWHYLEMQTCIHMGTFLTCS
jgi:hypothetical protein